jgi:hypothetical protein
MRIFGVGALAGLLLTACQSRAVDTTADLAELQRIHGLHRQAHMEHRADLLVGTFADGFQSVGGGRVLQPTRDESRARFQAYFDQSTFQEWDDITPPQYRISPDGQMAYVIVQKRVRLTSAVPDTGAASSQHTVFAWLETYEKVQGSWRLTALASTDRPGD